MGKLRTTLDLARSSWSVLKADKELLVLPLLSGVASLIVAATFVVPLFLVGGAEAEPTPAAYVLLFLMYVVLAIITIFSNAALIAGAHERLQGGDPTVGSALRAATGRLGQILPWAVISATVSILLQAVRQRGGAAGAGAAAAAGLAWSLVTFLVLPIIVIEGLPVRAAIGRSKDLFKRTWGRTWRHGSASAASGSCWRCRRSCSCSSARQPGPSDWVSRSPSRWSGWSS
jgi:hypothetical protein